VTEPTKKKRSKEIRELIKQSTTSFRNDLLGKNLNVLWENVIEGGNGFILEGLSGNFIRVQSHHEHNLYNTLAKVKITKIDGGVAVGDIIS
jgi:tRNA A37 methylthiotransferase MiaB